MARETTNPIFGVVNSLSIDKYPTNEGVEDLIDDRVTRANCSREVKRLLAASTPLV